MFDLSAALSRAADLPVRRVAGRVAQVTDSGVRVAGLGRLARIGDGVLIAAGAGVRGEIVGLAEAPGGGADAARSEATAMAFGAIDGAAIGDVVWLEPRREPRPSADWLGKVLDADGLPAFGPSPALGRQARPLRGAPPAAMRRRLMGGRVETGHVAFDTVLPICHGQRVGVFAGSGVGKSRLLAAFAQRMRADSVVIALIGERGREVREFVDATLGPEALARAIVIVATSDQPAAVKRRAAWLALTAAEFLRDRGDRVLLLFDSLTRFAEAHRDVAYASGEAPGYGGFPPSLTPAIASLAERAGPGPDQDGVGDITAIFTVLVAGGDMEEPVADISRGILDGHFILAREIAERGRFPAIDMRRSVSRALPHCASADENEMIAEARRVIAVYEQAEPMIQIGLYQPGADAEIDRAVRLWPALDRLWTQPSKGFADAFKRLREVLTPPTPAPARPDLSTRRR